MASIWMGMLEVEWDEEKAAFNLLKHGISFIEARLSFRMKMDFMNMMRAIRIGRIVST